MEWMKVVEYMVSSLWVISVSFRVVPPLSLGQQDGSSYRHHPDSACSNRASGRRRSARGARRRRARRRRGPRRRGRSRRRGAAGARLRAGGGGLPRRRGCLPRRAGRRRASRDVERDHGREDGERGVLGAAELVPARELVEGAAGEEVHPGKVHGRGERGGVEDRRALRGVCQGEDPRERAGGAHAVVRLVHRVVLALPVPSVCGTDAVAAGRGVGGRPADGDVGDLEHDGGGGDGEHGAFGAAVLVAAGGELVKGAAARKVQPRELHRGFEGSGVEGRGAIGVVGQGKGAAQRSRGRALVVALVHQVDLVAPRVVEGGGSLVALRGDGGGVPGRRVARGERWPGGERGHQGGGEEEVHEARHGRAEFGFRYDGLLGCRRAGS
ncbi:hypothetical protein DFJ74DRAFT_679972 [Hyaloraphidium curvatum]|nr:hypothetical protein DFJ74DRAFT_679972 [Hyaloraphidium curvatum]